MPDWPRRDITIRKITNALPPPFVFRALFTAADFSDFEINFTSFFVVEADLVTRFGGVFLVGDTLLKNAHSEVNTQTFSNSL